jgi:ATP-dependent Clp protease ATP-binding subunit ClpA
MEWKGKKVSESAKIILENAQKIAKRRGENIVDTDHLLYSLLTTSEKNKFYKFLEKN